METTLNLLPPKNKQSLHTALTMAFVQSLALFVTLVILIVAALLVSLRIIIQYEVDNNTKQSNSSFEEYDALTSQMQAINGYIYRVDETHQKFIDWSAVLESLAQSAPTGLKFESLSISPEMTLTVEGTAKTRDDVLSMEKQLKSYPHFTDISSPLSNILQKQNLRFEFQMTFIPPGADSE